MLWKAGIPAIFISIIFPRPALATDWTYTPLGAVSTELTGGYGAVGDPYSGNVYNDGFGSSSYPVILDSGSSAHLMSQTVTDSFNVPLTGQTYPETGLGGQRDRERIQRGVDRSHGRGLRLLADLGRRRVLTFR